MKTNDPGKLDRVVAEARRHADERAQGYREKALKIYPGSVAVALGVHTQKCARADRAPQDHDHDNNPPDGSNWELLCLYCHDNEHQRQLEATGVDGGGSGSGRRRPLRRCGLKDMLERSNTEVVRALAL